MLDTRVAPDTRTVVVATEVGATHTCVRVRHDGRIYRVEATDDTHPEWMELLSEPGRFSPERLSDLADLVSSCNMLKELA